MVHLPCTHSTAVINHAAWKTLLEMSVRLIAILRATWPTPEQSLECEGLRGFPWLRLGGALSGAGVADARHDLLIVQPFFKLILSAFFARIVQYRWHRYDLVGREHLVRHRLCLLHHRELQLPTLFDFPGRRIGNISDDACPRHFIQNLLWKIQASGLSVDRVEYYMFCLSLASPVFGMTII